MTNTTKQLTRESMKVSGRYNWINQPERLVYLGRNWSGNGYWHQFEEVGKPGAVWCEVLDKDLHMLEETTPVVAPQIKGATYTGPETGWNVKPGLHALIQDSDKPEIVLAQFDDFHITRKGVDLSRGWHAFPKEHFKEDDTP